MLPAGFSLIINAWRCVWCWRHYRLIIRLVTSTSRAVVVAAAAASIWQRQQQGVAALLRAGALRNALNDCGRALRFAVHRFVRSFGNNPISSIRSASAVTAAEFYVRPDGVSLCRHRSFISAKTALKTVPGSATAAPRLRGRCPICVAVRRRLDKGHCRGTGEASGLGHRPLVASHVSVFLRSRSCFSAAAGPVSDRDDSPSESFALLALHGAAHCTAPCVRADVGDRFVCFLLRTTDASVGACVYANCRG